MSYHAPVTNETSGVAVRILRSGPPRAEALDDVARAIIELIRDYSNGKSTSLGQTPAQKQVEESLATLAGVQAKQNDPVALALAEEYLAEDQQALAEERVLGMDHILHAADGGFNRALAQLKTITSWFKIHLFTGLSVSTIQNRIHHDELRTKRGD